MSTITLPAYLFDTYAYYKKSTAAFIQWLSAHGGKTGARSHIDSTRELIHLTETVVRNRIKVPHRVLQDLRRAIRDRTRVGRFFKNFAASKDHGATSSHEYFTGILQRAYNDLRELAEEAQEIITAPEREQLELSNAFECLLAEDCPEYEDGIPCAAYEKQPKGVSRKRRSKHASRFGTDYVSEFMALSTYLLVSHISLKGQFNGEHQLKKHQGVGSIGCGDQTKLGELGRGKDSAGRGSNDC
jgi:hypothetical protein